MPNTYQGFEGEYEECDQAPCATAEVPVSTVHVQLVAFKGPDGVLASATVLADTGAMANFVNESFIRKHDLPLRSRKKPIRCVGFAGSEGVGGIVKQDWPAGVIQLNTLSSKPFPLGCSFGVTRLGSINAIFGLPWLDKQGWIASGSLKGGPQFTLGSTSLYVIEALTMGGKPEGKVLSSSQKSPSSSTSLIIPQEFQTIY
ncbi:hypothetical protein PGT21_023962 [Puccinia graminis f. sp. tritici]|uniref:Peptidase A2 domain-containing protein n=1 Tax=Puccinia graminis f. sp. tritici TaxID=56615 RepID=A0A5B0Q6E5_PUCGR|nr:hypothetical protein PGT21_023962 [Puccinia graminis f. sp. tritici]